MYYEKWKTEKINYTGNRSRKYICTCSMRKLKTPMILKEAIPQQKKIPELFIVH